MKRTSVGAVTLVILVGAWFLVGRAHDRVYRFHYENVLGTSMALTVLASSESAARAAESAVIGQIARDAQILSGYEPTSEFSRWFKTQHEATPVSAELFEVLGLFDTWRDRTGGALDPSSERVSRVWKEAAARNELPSEDDVSAAVTEVRQPDWRLDPVAGTAEHLNTTPLLLNSFTKIYIVDRAASVAMASAGIRGVVVNVGGDLVTRGAWTERVRVADPIDHAENGTPLANLSVQNRAVATSGGYRRGFDIKGRHYSHIVDPRTGRPTGHVLSATVVAGHAVDAGALATAFCVLSPEESETLAARIPNVDFLLVLADGSRIESPGWRALEVPPTRTLAVPNPVATLHASEQTWSPAFELTVSMQLARPGGFPKRPYVAVWIEDQDKFPVRTIALWFGGTRWLPELRAWSRSNRVREATEGTDITESISSATRSPGSYSFKWDGKDQHGKLVKAGTYMVLIEVAREHGTYQILRQSMDFSGVPKRVELAGNDEVDAAVLDYHKAGGL
jgi:thiamine biosynthesis lipoprotein